MNLDKYECDGQMTIFDVLAPPSELDLLTEEEMVKIVIDRTGIPFVYQAFDNPWTDYQGEWIAKVKKCKFSIHYSTYSNTDQRFISVGYEFKTSGGGAPRDTIDEAVKYLLRIKNNYIEKEVI